MRKSIYQIAAIALGFFLYQSSQVLAQEREIDLEEALQVARSNYAGLERDRLSVERFEKLAGHGRPAPMTQIFFSGEEFGSGESGIHTLNVQQNFYLPGVAKAQKAYYRKNSQVAQSRLEMTENALEWEVKKAYYQLLYVREEQELIDANSDLYQEFMDVASRRMEAGETGKIPLLAARTRLGQARLEQEHAEERYQIALSLFNQWLNSAESFNAAGELSAEETQETDTSLFSNPHLAVFKAKEEMAHSAIAVQESMLLPQVNTGAGLQTVDGSFPFFRYQVGMNVPLFRGAYRSKIEAAQIQVKEYEAARATEQQKLNRVITNLGHRMEHQHHVIEYLRDDLQPIVGEQIEVNLKAYKEGEISYLEYLNSLEEDISLRRQYLDALYEFNLIKAELDYWTGR